METERTLIKKEHAKEMDVLAGNLFLAMKKILSFVARKIEQSKENSYQTFSKDKGRKASEKFEKIIAIPVIKRNEASILKYANKIAKEYGFIFTGILVPGEGESGRRDSADFYLRIEHMMFSCPYLIPVNIKYTKGSGKDNVAGKKAIRTVLGLSDRGEFLDCTNLTFSDYYILSFAHGTNKPTESKKGKDGEKGNKCFEVISLLHSDPKSKGVAFNGVQSSGLQMTVSEVDPSPFGCSVSKNRREWSLWLSANNKKESNKRRITSEQQKKDAYRFA